MLRRQEKGEMVSRSVTQADDSADQRADSLVDRLIVEMGDRTREKIAGDALKNARANVPYLAKGRSLAALLDETIGEGDSAIVIAAGPSIKRTHPAAAIKAAGYKGAIVATESALRYCLSNGIVPDLVVTVDPRPRLVRWFGNRNLSREQMESDRWFGRAGLDEYFKDEVKANAEVTELVDRHGKGIRLAVATSSSREVIERALDVGMELYFWNPMYDDPDDPDSMTAGLQRENRLPCVNAGGNVGATCWMMASAVLGKRKIAITGMDYAYYDGTPLELTQHYQELKDIAGKNALPAMFPRIYNPYAGAWFYTDPVYMWYRRAFFDMVRDADCVTVNCTGGGILFGEGIEYASPEMFLRQYA